MRRPQALADGTANGFSFSTYDVDHLEQALNRACHMYGHEPDRWQQLVTTGMNQDWSWTPQRSAVRRAVRDDGCQKRR